MASLFICIFFVTLWLAASPSIFLDGLKGKHGWMSVLLYVWFIVVIIDVVGEVYYVP